MPCLNPPGGTHPNNATQVNYSTFPKNTGKTNYNQIKKTKDSEEFINSLRSIAPYIHNLKNKIFVIACSASTFVCKEKFANFTHDISLLNAIGIQIVLIHGSPHQFEKQIHQNQHTSEYSHDVRITDSTMMDYTKAVIGKIRLDIEAAFSQVLPNTPMANSSIRIISGNFVTARPLGILNGVDYQYTGIVSKVDKESIIELLQNKKIVLLSPIGFSVTGEAFNLSTEDVASSTAIALSANKLIYLSEFNEFLEKKKKTFNEMYVDEAEELIRLNDINMNLTNHINMAIKSCRNGVNSTHLASINKDGAILLELLTKQRTGITIKANSLEDLREANSGDIENIIKLIEPLEQNGTLVQRNRNQLKRDIFNFSVIERNKMLLGCAALFPYTKEKVGEMACLTVFPAAQGSGNGEKLLKQIEKRASALGLEKIFVLTVRTEHWFLKRGFVKSSVEHLPEDRKKLYNWQRRSLVLIKHL